VTSPRTGAEKKRRLGLSVADCRAERRAEQTIGVHTSVRFTYSSRHRDTAGEGNAKTYDAFNRHRDYCGETSI
jgi:hypothetical protein